MKKTIKQLIPPLVIKIIRKIIFPKTKKYQKYEDVVNDSKEEYNNDELSKVVSVKTKIYIDKLYKQEIQFSYEDQKLLNLFCLNDNRSLNILDIGGGSGIHYHTVKSQYNLDLNWTVLETPEMVKSNKNNNFQGLNYSDDIESLKDVEFDLIYLSSVIHYIPKPYDFLEKIFSLKSNKIIITRTPLKNQGKEYYTLQKSMLSSNGPGELPKNFKDKHVTYPRYSFNINKFKSFLEKYNTKVITIDDGTHIFGRDEMFSKTFIIIK
jgi:putative methyltransferase (TIGR04325 family)